MADPTPDISPDNIPAAPKPKLAEALARIAELEAKLDAFRLQEETVRARDEEARQNRANGVPRRLLGQIPVYDQDERVDVLERARALMKGQIPVDRAKRFRTEAHIMIPKASPLAKRLGTHAPPVGVEFERDEISDQDRNDLALAGAIVAIE